MIHYHGGPITPNLSGLALWRGRHALVSFALPEQIALAAEITQSFIVDNGAYSMWKSGIKPDWKKYYEWLEVWGRHPGCDFAMIPDAIAGDEQENKDLWIEWLSERRPCRGAVVWHLHESLERLEALAYCDVIIALGSSGRYAKVGTVDWWGRMAEAMKVVCDGDGRPRARLHGLRMLNPTIFSHIPLSSADSTVIARCIKYDTRWPSPYTDMSRELRALVLAERIERHASAARWNGEGAGVQENLDLLG